jgi:hypothetical protein
MMVGDREVRVEGRLVRIARLAAEGYEGVDDPGAMLDRLRRCGSRVDLFTFVQDVAGPVPTHRYPLEWDNVAALPVSSFEHWWTRQVSDKTRNRVRHAGRQGVAVRRVPFDDALVRGISRIYDETPMRQGRRFWHYGKDLDAVRRENATFLDRSVFLAATLRDELIGYAKLVVGPTQAGLMQILAMVQHRDKAVPNALVAEAVRVCAERQVPYLVYAKFTYGTKRPDSLADFKRYNGFQRFEVPRYYVPLTLVGRLALGLGLHRDVAAYVPDALQNRLRTLRRRWSARRLRTADPA